MPLRKFKKFVPKKPVKKSKKKAPSKTIVKAVKTVMRRSAETKYVSRYINNQQLNYVTLTSQAQTFLLTPAITQGVRDDQRIGNQIMTSSTMFRYRLYAPTTASTPARLIRVLILKEKTHPVRDPANSIGQNSSLFKANTNQTTLGPQNNDLDQILKINNDVWITLYDKHHKVGSSGNPSTISHNNNDFSQSVMVSVSLQKHFGKIQWDDGSNTPLTKNIYVFFLISNPDGSTGTSGADTGIKLTYDVQMSYKDL